MLSHYRFKYTVTDFCWLSSPVTAEWLHSFASQLTFNLLVVSSAGKMLMTDLLKADEIKKALEAFAGQWKQINTQISFKHTRSKDTNH